MDFFVTLQAEFNLKILQLYMELVKSMIRFTVLIVSLVLGFVSPLSAQNYQRTNIERIKAQGNRFLWGEGRADNKDKADAAALNNLASKIKVSVVSSTDNNMTNTTEDWKSKFTVSSAATLSNLEEIPYQDGEDWVVFRYISVENLQKAIDSRREAIVDLIEQGMMQEQYMNIAGALKYYNWALTMISAYDDDVKIKVDGKEVKARHWLEPKISSVLNNITYSIVEGKLEYDDDPTVYDHYTVILQTLYAGKPVAALDATYFNGESTYTVHAKNGETLLKFPNLEGMNSIDINVEYAYAREAREGAGSSELRAAYTGTSGAYSDGSRAYHSVPLKYAKGQIKAGKPQADKKQPQADVRPQVNAKELEANIPSVDPIVKTDRRTIERPMVEEKEYVAVMQKVEAAIRSKNYVSVKDLFTPEGYEIFRMMTTKAALSMAAPATYTIERSQLFTIGKGLPVAVKNGKHVSKETMVFRFEDGKPIIKSVAYALTQKAENDIFCKADWSLESRYSMLCFMEDYQTAFAVQNLEYIKKIFSDNAIIITGKYANSKKGGLFFDQGVSMSNKPVKNVVFTHQTKDQYMNNLAKLFKNNQWTHIEFEENEISKASTNDILGHEVMWIEIRQNWTSASGYNDTGFLSLQINLKPSGSQINVRTWSPEFIPMEELKTRFNTNIFE